MEEKFLIENILLLPLLKSSHYNRIIVFNSPSIFIQDFNVQTNETNYRTTRGATGIFVGSSIFFVIVLKRLEAVNGNIDIIGMPLYRKAQQKSPRDKASREEP